MTRLVEPVRLGSREARTRLVFGPHETNLAKRRALSDRHVAYYRARAAGGAGVIVVEEASVDDSDWPYERAPLAAHAGEGWSRISVACQDEGALVIAALGHAGGQGSSAYHQRCLLGPSGVPDVETREAPKAMEEEDVERLVAAFHGAAATAVAAGCDGVELNAGQYSLLRQFCSGLTNLRSDELGVCRAELVRRVIRATREAVDRVATGAVVGLRLSCDELAPWAGIVPEAAAGLAGTFAALGLDYVCVVRGSAFGTSATRPDGHVEPGFNRGTGAAVRPTLPAGVALVAQGSIVDVALAEELLAGGEADLVEMTRAQIADPLLGNKVASGEAARIRPCVLCNQTCRVRDVRNPIVTCIGEPRSGHETADPPADPPAPAPAAPAPAAPPATALAAPPATALAAPPATAPLATEQRTGLLVIGGGPAGLECARVAASAGHEVTLLERGDRLGGMVRVAARAPGRERLELLVDWLESECREAGVRVLTGHEVTLEEIDGHAGPVVHCTGSRPGRRTFEVAHGVAVAAAAEVLAAERRIAEPPPSPVVVWDPIGGPIGVGVAELLATHGAAVTLVSPDHVLGEQLARSGDLAPSNVRLQQRGVELVRRSVLREVGPAGATVEDRFSGERRLIEASLCVDAGFLLPEDTLWRASGARFARGGRGGAADHPRGDPRRQAGRPCARASGSARRRIRLMTASRRYPLLFSPLRVGPVTVENRIVFSAHLTNYAEDGLPTDQHAAYYEARAAGGAGLVITEEHSVHVTDWPYEKLVHGFDPAVIPGYRRITDRVHRHGTPIFAQINHNGGQGTGMYSRLPVWAPSAVADPLFREVPQAVEEAEIDEIVAGYAEVAAHCAQGGFDGVELQCSHSSIVRSFLSPATNLRTDGYGGSLERRARILFEILRAVRDTLGTKLALGVRLCGDELIDGGTTITEAVAVARMVDEQGCADYVNTSIGVATATLYMIEASMHVPPGYASFIPSAFREAVSLPVVGAGRYKDPAQAERALRAGHCDLVGVVRGQIADPDFAVKARSGRADTIRLCLSCNQECVGRMGLNRWLGCIENPRTGREAEIALRSGPAAHPGLGPGPGPDAEIAQRRRPVAQRRRRVLVAGAGPAGLQAAIAAAIAGHEVLALEKASEPGGQIRLAATVPNRAELGDLVRNQVVEARELDVELRLGAEATLATVVRERPDAVIVATGSRPERPWWASEPPPGAPGFADVVDVLQGSASPEGRVLVVDELGFHQATSVAELLADRGCAVEIATPAMVVGQDLGLTLDLEGFNMRAAAKGIAQSTDRVVMGLEPGAALLLHHPTGVMERRLVDWVVMAGPPAPEDHLYRELRAGAPELEVRRVGDCVAPRRAHAAVVEGDRAGSSL